jgi:hypothetical protein
VFDLAPRFRLGVGPASSKRWGDGVRKKGEDKQPYIPLGLGIGIRSGVCGKSTWTGFSLFPAVVTCRSLQPKSGRCEGRLAREMAASAFHRASLRSRSRATCCRSSQPNFHIANGPNMATFYADIAGTVAAMTESDPGVASERTSCNALG